MDAKYSAMLPWLPKVLSAQSMKRPLFVLPQCLANLTQRSLTFCWRASGASERQHKRGYTWRLFWHRLTQPFCQYLGHVSSDAKSFCSSLTSVWWFCVNFLVIFGHFGKEIFFLKGWVKLRKIRNVEDLMDLENWNLKWRISRQIPNIPLPTWGSHLGWSTVWKCFQPLLILSIPY